jgi:hypothetical protein
MCKGCAEILETDNFGPSIERSPGVIALVAGLAVATVTAVAYGAIVAGEHALRAIMRGSK